MALLLLHILYTLPIGRLSDRCSIIGINPVIVVMFTAVFFFSLYKKSLKDCHKWINTLLHLAKFCLIYVWAGPFIKDIIIFDWVISSELSINYSWLQSRLHWICMNLSSERVTYNYNFHSFWEFPGKKIKYYVPWYVALWWNKIVKSMGHW